MTRMMTWITVSILSVLFLYTPYLRGLFFDSDMYLTEVIVALVFLACAIYRYTKKELVQHNSNIYLILFIVPFTYIISLTHSETFSGAIENVLRWITYSALFLMLLWMRNSSLGDKVVDKLLANMFHLTGTWIAFFSVFGSWGWFEFKDLLLDYRLTGTFQYANTFAAVICSFWLFALFTLTNKNSPLWRIVLFSLPLVAYGIGLFYSYSRGVFLVFPFVWLLGLLILKIREQLAYILFTAVSTVAALFVFKQMVSTAESEIHVGVIPFFVTTLITIIVNIIIHLLMKRVNGNNGFIKLEARKLVKFVLPGVFIVLVLLIMLDLKSQGLIYQQLPESMQARVSDISLETSSLLGRTNVYEDAFKVVSDTPLIGIGGDGWKVAYTRYQELPYFNNEVHNGYLEILVSTGWFGLITFVLVIGGLFLLIYRRLQITVQEDERLTIKAAVVAVLMLFIHGAIDFDFSYGTVWFMIIWLLALAVPTEPILKRKWHLTSIIEKAILGVVTVCVLFFGIFAARFLLAEKSVSALSSEMSIEDAQSVFERAVFFYPYKVEYHQQLADLYLTRYQNEKNDDWKTKAIEQISVIEELEPNNANALLAISKKFLVLGEWDKSFEYLDKTLKNDRFSSQAFDVLIQVKTQIAIQYNQAGNKEKAIKYAKQALEHYKQYELLFDHYKEQSIPDKRNLELNEQTHLFIEQAKTIIG
ncbi:O-antigen ligase family protein [Brevibacillus migulae]|uniref:O-antigen ligase family protein n=1 Tax=Brevibacillus migulae TaxID=1644114 RepID=UPI00106EF73D|nr:O-antigen ligase family protein [Brevibacillus migulae]